MSTTATQVKSYALVGAGGRGWSFVKSVIDKYKDDSRLTGLCDVNQGRLDLYNSRLKEHGLEPVPTFAAEDFDEMIRQTKPDAVIVTTVDGFHHQYIIRAMELGCDVITEKPMTIDDEKCRQILDAQQRTGKDIRVTFNYRFGAAASHVKQLLRDGIIGEIVSVDMEYMLDVSHGADYYRRWHRYKNMSGGLLVHKATHHFDLVNWWIDAVPAEVFAFGRLKFYGKENAEARGMAYDYDRYTGHVTPEQDPFALDLSANEGLKAMYLDCEKYDGYKRDQNVFGEGITIEDSMSVLVKYRNGVQLTYSLNAFLPKEGYHVAFNGTDGRLTLDLGASPHIITGEGDETEVAFSQSCFVQKPFGKVEQIELPEAGKGGHGGADPILHDQIFDPTAEADALDRNAGHEQGAASILIGIAANQAIAQNKPVSIDKLCPQLPKVDRLSQLK